mmetsp:Transcript_66435/g.197711  ORF Transcript_66435/g.197711 Transcript_66435/m.197711 type:complete len:664 (-) Transcript_66435:147-2138(-)
MPAAPSSASVQFSHVHWYCDSLRSPEEYQKLERKLNDFSISSGSAESDVAAGREAWLALQAAHGDPVARVVPPEGYKSVGQDIVEQLLVGLGWRVTGSHAGPSTHSLVVTSPDPDGVKFVVTAHNQHPLDELASRSTEHPEQKRQRHMPDDFGHFDAVSLERFAAHHAGRQGVAVLGFVTSGGGVDRIAAKYRELHPKLLCEGMPRQYCGAKVLEVFAYYQGEKFETDADHGTLLRFVEPAPDGADLWVLPGTHRIEAKFDGVTQPAYCDHWVSNVFSRTGFLDTLNDVLGFTPKVDFNAGVVAAGEAQIESTVTGNEPGMRTGDRQTALRDQSQVYLPINNALSEVGHVHLYLHEIGQGVQHIASRVADLPGVVQRANDFRVMTGAGLAFLSIPRSYYGTLTAKQLSKDAEIEDGLAEQCLASLKSSGIVDGSGIVDLGASREAVAAALPDTAPDSVVEHVLRARYRNLYALAGDAVSEETYLKVVRNNILMDVQGDDLLMQIFSCNVLQRTGGEEAPFLEFIQRVCSERPDPATGEPRAVKPGCGGFGIRNFLTLFLSIEVSKAAKAREEARAAGDAEAAGHYGRMVELFTEQLDESNPVLTAISDAMTAEGEALERGDMAAVAQHEAEKAAGQAALQRISSKYKDLMAELRRGRAELVAA